MVAQAVSFKSILRRAAWAALLSAACLAAPAQWLNYPNPATPRTRDGKPNLAAPTPKAPDSRPDLSGVWVAADNKYLRNLAADGIDVPFRPETLALYKQRQETLGKDKPSGRCLPHGIPDAMLVQPAPFKILQTPGVTAVLYEVFNHYRQIYTDGRPLPKATPLPAWLGYSVGKWADDTLVVETTGFNDLSWLDDGGHPHSDALHTTERFRRRDFGHMDMQFTIDDPKAYTKPWTVNIGFNLIPDSDVIEFICDENEKDAPHMVGK